MPLDGVREEKVALKRPAIQGRAESFEEETQAEPKADLSSLSSMLNARWKGGTAGGGSKLEAIRGGQIRSFRIAKLDPAAKKIELELA